MLFLWFWLWPLSGLFSFTVDASLFSALLLFTFSPAARLTDSRNSNPSYWLNSPGSAIPSTAVGLGNFSSKVVSTGLLTLGRRICSLSSRRVVENFAESSANECPAPKRGCQPSLWKKSNPRIVCKFKSFSTCTQISTVSSSSNICKINCRKKPLTCVFTLVFMSIDPFSEFSPPMVSTKRLAILSWFLRWKWTQLHNRSTVAVSIANLVWLGIEGTTPGGPKKGLLWTCRPLQSCERSKNHNW